MNNELSDAIQSGLDPVLLLRKKLGLSYVKDSAPGLLGKALRLIGEGTVEGPALQSLLNIQCELHRSAIVIVGCGGTGSHLVPNVLQFIASKKKTDENWVVPQIFLVDGDKIEERNLIRQKFVSAEVGTNKAKALAKRYSAIWELPVSYYEGYVDKDILIKLLGEDVTRNYDSLIIMGAVDNHLARLEILKYMMAHADDQFAKSTFNNGLYWIDGGNESHHGQAILTIVPGRYSDRRRVASWEFAKMGDTIPSVRTSNIFERHPSILSKIEQRKDEGSCIALSEIDPQTIQANMMSAFCMTSLLIQLLQGETTSTSIYFDAKTGNTCTRFITKETILEDFRIISEGGPAIKTALEKDYSIQEIEGGGLLINPDLDVAKDEVIIDSE